MLDALSIIYLVLTTIFQAHATRSLIQVLRNEGVSEADQLGLRRITSIVVKTMIDDTMAFTADQINKQIKAGLSDRNPDIVNLATHREGYLKKWMESPYPFSSQVSGLKNLILALSSHPTRIMTNLPQCRAEEKISHLELARQILEVARAPNTRSVLIHRNGGLKLIAPMVLETMKEVGSSVVVKVERQFCAMVLEAMASHHIAYLPWKNTTGSGTEGSTMSVEQWVKVKTVTPPGQRVLAPGASVVLQREMAVEQAVHKRRRLDTDGPWTLFEGLLDDMASYIGFQTMPEDLEFTSLNNNAGGKKTNTEDLNFRPLLQCVQDNFQPYIQPRHRAIALIAAILTRMLPTIVMNWEDTHLPTMRDSPAALEQFLQNSRTWSAGSVKIGKSTKAARIWGTTFIVVGVLLFDRNTTNQMNTPLNQGLRSQFISRGRKFLPDYS